MSTSSGSAGGATEGLRTRQFYWPDSNILVTRFLHPSGLGEIEDFMPLLPSSSAGSSSHHPATHNRSDIRLVRRVRVSRGALPFALRCRPAFDYARARHHLALDPHGATFSAPAHAGGLTLRLLSSVPLRVDGDGVAADFVLRQGESAEFLLCELVDPDGPSAECGACPGADAVEDLFRGTLAYWQRWLSRCTYRGRFRERVQRSALALKLLTYQPSGAIVAAATTSLPEAIGGPRNWDYRFCWLRDAAFTVYALLRIGFTEEAAAFMRWLEARWQEDDGPSGHASGPLQVVYGIDGQSDLTEYELPHLEGYRGSRPVRIGNAAAGQLQLDIYGELLDSRPPDIPIRNPRRSRSLATVDVQKFLMRFFLFQQCQHNDFNGLQAVSRSERVIWSWG